MPAIHQVATVTSKGQITLPKPIRQALGVGVGGKVAFDLRGSEVIVTRAEELPHNDPAIGSYLNLLEADIRSGRNINTLPDALVQAMLATLMQPANMLKSAHLGEDIEGDVAL